MRILALAASIGMLFLPAAVRAAEVAQDSGSRLGTVRLLEHAGDDLGLLFLFSRDGAWSDADARDAAAATAAGFDVVGLDSGGVLARAQAAEQGDCVYLVSDIEALSKTLRRQFGTTRYASPVLAGRGLGGLLAEVALAQAPAATVAGAVVARPAEALPGPRPFCAGAASQARGDGFAYRLAEAALPGWLRRLPDDGGQAPADLAGADLVAAAVEALRDAAGEGPLSDLPLVELPAADGRPRALAVVLSGDGGWRDLDKEIAERLARRGVAAVGWDSLRYFWSRKTPAEVAADLARVLRHYRALWSVDRVLLVGYSFGADVLPAAIAALPAAERAAISQVSLLGIGPSAHFEIQVEGWLGLGEADGAPIAPALAGLDPAKVQCFMGREEDDSLCRDAYFDRAERIVTAGGHHFDGDYDALAERILAGLDRRV